MSRSASVLGNRFYALSPCLLSPLCMEAKIAAMSSAFRFRKPSQTLFYPLERTSSLPGAGNGCAQWMGRVSSWKAVLPPSLHQAACPGHGIPVNTALFNHAAIFPLTQGKSWWKWGFRDKRIKRIRMCFFQIASTGAISWDSLLQSFN